jgi:SpoVK/Ycf46/Vps4 family AAA+-type ATPase
MLDDAIRRREQGSAGLPPIAGPAHPDPGCALPGLARATSLFRLTSFERDVLLVALACDIDATCARKIAELEGHHVPRHPSISTVLAVLDPWLGDARAAAFATLSPSSRLMQLGLLEVAGDGPYTSRQVRVPPLVWRRILGLAVSPEAALLAVPSGGLAALVLSPATADRTARMVSWLQNRAPEQATLSIVGRSGCGRHTLAAVIADALGYAALSIERAMLEDPRSLRAAAFDATWRRAAIVATAAPGIAEGLDGIRTTPLIFIVDPDEQDHDTRRHPAIHIQDLPEDLRLDAWRAALAASSDAASVDPSTAATKFRFGAGKIRRVVATAVRSAQIDARRVTEDDLVTAAREAAASAIDRRVQRLSLPYEIGDLVLTPATARELQLVIAWARHREHAFGTTGAGRRISGRDHLACLFWGPPGTGKTMAAQIVARSLGLELWRVDLSQIVNKYIGETEKNLDHVFDEAEAVGAMLFFDEADALFAKRTDVHDAQDRYANMETAFLLQRIEHHRGLVVLASNLRKNFDDAFGRRLQVIAEFGLPDAADRKAIWERHLAPETLAADVDLSYLARQFALAGGDIRNAATTAVLLAAPEQETVAMRHLVIAVSRELRKLGRMLTSDDLKHWDATIRAYQQSHPTLFAAAEDRA